MRRHSDFNTQAIAYDSQAISIAITRSTVKHNINTQSIAYDSQAISIAITRLTLKQSRSIDFNTQAMFDRTINQSHRYSSNVWSIAIRTVSILHQTRRCDRSIDRHIDTQAISFIAISILKIFLIHRDSDFNSEGKSIPWLNDHIDTQAISLIAIFLCGGANQIFNHRR